MPKEKLRVQAALPRDQFGIILPSSLPDFLALARDSRPRDQDIEAFLEEIETLLAHVPSMRPATMFNDCDS